MRIVRAFTFKNRNFDIGDESTLAKAGFENDMETLRALGYVTTARVTADKAKGTAEDAPNNDGEQEEDEEVPAKAAKKSSARSSRSTSAKRTQ